MQADLMLEAVSKQRANEKKRWTVIGTILAVLVVSFILDVATGPSMLDVSRVGNALLQWLSFPVSVDPMTQVIVTNLRLPIALMAVIVGARLALVVQKCKPC
jgi:iron complex transport system permease protein